MEDLLKVIKQRLNVTWDYDDEEINNIILEGQDFLQRIIGKTDFESNAGALRLLKEYCRYSWNGAISSFQVDYQRDLITYQISNARKILDKE